MRGTDLGELVRERPVHHICRCALGDADDVRVLAALLVLRYGNFSRLAARQIRFGLDANADGPACAGIELQLRQPRLVRHPELPRQKPTGLHEGVNGPDDVIEVRLGQVEALRGVARETRAGDARRGLFFGPRRLPCRTLHVIGNARRLCRSNRFGWRRTRRRSGIDAFDRHHHLPRKVRTIEGHLGLPRIERSGGGPQRFDVHRAPQAREFRRQDFRCEQHLARLAAERDRRAAARRSGRARHHPARLLACGNRQHARVERRQARAPPRRGNLRRCSRNQVVVHELVFRAVVGLARPGGLAEQIELLVARARIAHTAARHVVNEVPRRTAGRIDEHQRGGQSRPALEPEQVLVDDVGMKRPHAGRQLDRHIERLGLVLNLRAGNAAFRRLASRCRVGRGVDLLARPRGILAQRFGRAPFRGFEVVAERRVAQFLDQRIEVRETFLDGRLARWLRRNGRRRFLRPRRPRRRSRFRGRLERRCAWCRRLGCRRLRGRRLDLRHRLELGPRTGARNGGRFNLRLCGGGGTRGYRSRSFVAGHCAGAAGLRLSNAVLLPFEAGVRRRFRNAFSKALHGRVGGGFARCLKDVPGVAAILSRRLVDREIRRASGEPADRARHGLETASQRRVRRGAHLRSDGFARQPADGLRHRDRLERLRDGGRRGAADNALQQTFEQLIDGEFRVLRPRSFGERRGSERMQPAGRRADEHHVGERAAGDLSGLRRDAGGRCGLDGGGASARRETEALPDACRQRLNGGHPEIDRRLFPAVPATADGRVQANAGEAADPRDRGNQQRAGSAARRDRHRGSDDRADDRDGHGRRVRVAVDLGGIALRRERGQLDRVLELAPVLSGVVAFVVEQRAARPARSTLRRRTRRSRLSRFSAARSCP